MNLNKIVLLVISFCLIITVSVSGKSWNVISIDKIDDVHLDEQVIMTVDLNQGTFDIGSFKLSIYFDPDALSLTSASLGSIFDDCNWEYFTYSVEPCATCDYSIVNMEAVADYYEDGHTPTCLCGPGPIASMVFQTTADSAYACTTSPIGFYWDDCEDNLFFNMNRDTLWFSDYVADIDGNDVTGTEYFGGAPKTCLQGLSEVPYRFLDFNAGGMYFKCPLAYLCGDINGDGKISLLDPVFLVTYLFKSGPAPDPLARGDVNCSNDIPNLDDLVYIINYIFNHGDEPCCL
jgi:Dockerin type I domain